MNLLLRTLLGVCLLAATSLSAQTIIGNMDDIANPWSLADATSMDVGNFDGDPDNELRVITPGATPANGQNSFTAALTLDVPRSGPVFDLIRLNNTIEWDYDGSDNTASFTNSFFIINTDVRNAGFVVLDGSFASVNSTTGTYSYDHLLASNADVPGILDDWAGGAGSFLGLFIIQQTSDAFEDDVSTLYYDNFRVTNPVPEPSTYAAIIGALALGYVVYRRRR